MVTRRTFTIEGPLRAPTTTTDRPTIVDVEMVVGSLQRLLRPRLLKGWFGYLYTHGSCYVMGDCSQPKSDTRKIYANLRCLILRGYGRVLRVEAVADLLDKAAEEIERLQAHVNLGERKVTPADLKTAARVLRFELHQQEIDRESLKKMLTSFLQSLK